VQRLVGQVCVFLVREAVEELVVVDNLLAHLEFHFTAEDLLVQVGLDPLTELLDSLVQGYLACGVDEGRRVPVD